LTTQTQAYVTEKDMNLKQLNIVGMTAAAWLLLAFVDSILMSANSFYEMSTFGKVCTVMFLICFAIIFLGAFIIPILTDLYYWFKK
jgi:hypothetical protein